MEAIPKYIETQRVLDTSVIDMLKAGALEISFEKMLEMMGLDQRQFYKTVSQNRTYAAIDEFLDETGLALAPEDMVAKQREVKYHRLSSVHTDSIEVTDYFLPNVKKSGQDYRVISEVNGEFTTNPDHLVFLYAEEEFGQGKASLGRSPNETPLYGSNPGAPAWCSD